LKEPLFVPIDWDRGVGKIFGVEIAPREALGVGKGKEKTTERLNSCSPLNLNVVNM